IALGEHSTSGQNLDYVHAVFHLRAHYVADLVDAVGDLKVAFLGKHAHTRLRRIIVQVAMTAGDRNARSTGYSAGSRNQAFVDQIPEIDGEKRRRANITHAGKTGFQRLARVDHRGKRALEWRVLEAIDLVVTVGPRAEMGVAIDQAGQDRGVRKINHR